MKTFHTPGSVHSLTFLGLLSFCYLPLAQDSVGLWAVTGHQWLSLSSDIDSWRQLRWLKMGPRVGLDLGGSAGALGILELCLRGLHPLGPSPHSLDRRESFRHCVCGQQKEGTHWCPLSPKSCQTGRGE